MDLFRNHRLMIRRWAAVLLLITFLVTGTVPVPNYAQAQGAVNLPSPGTKLSLSQPYVPPVLKGIKVFPHDPLRFDFILDEGRSAGNEQRLQEDSRRFIKYFLAALTIPDKDLWVNLSPYEKDRIITEDFGQTEMGRDILAQDYLLKQLTASLTAPDTKEGRVFWDAVYKNAWEKWGTSDVPVDAFFKVWIMPQEAVVYEKDAGCLITRARLKVLMDADYQALKHQRHSAESEVQQESRKVFRSILLPIIEKEINEGERFAPLRQIYHSLILAKWFKERQQKTLLGSNYVNQRKTAGIDEVSQQENQSIWARYVLSFHKGVFRVVREEKEPWSGDVIPRKYFSGGVRMEIGALQRTGALSDAAMTAPRVVEVRLTQINDNAELSAVSGAGEERKLEDVTYSDGERVLSAAQIERLQRTERFSNKWGLIDGLVDAGFRGDDIIKLIEQPLEEHETRRQLEFLHWFGLSRDEIVQVMEFSAGVNIEQVFLRLIQSGVDYPLVIRAMRHGCLDLLQQIVEYKDLFSNEDLTRILRKEQVRRNSPSFDGADFFNLNAFLELKKVWESKRAPVSLLREIFLYPKEFKKMFLEMAALEEKRRSVPAKRLEKQLLDNSILEAADMEPLWGVLTIDDEHRQALRRVFKAREREEGARTQVDPLLRRAKVTFQIKGFPEETIEVWRLSEAFQEYWARYPRAQLYWNRSMGNGGAQIVWNSTPLKWQDLLRSGRIITHLTGEQQIRIGFTKEPRSFEQGLGQSFVTAEQEALVDMARFIRSQPASSEVGPRLRSLRRGGLRLFSDEQVVLLQGRADLADVIEAVYLLGMGQKVSGEARMTNGALFEMVKDGTADDAIDLYRDKNQEAWREEVVGQEKVRRLMEIKRDGKELFTLFQRKFLLRMDHLQQRLQIAKELASWQEGGKYSFSPKNIFELVSGCKAEHLDELVMNARRFSFNELYTRIYPARIEKKKAPLPEPEEVKKQEQRKDRIKPLPADVMRQLTALEYSDGKRVFNEEQLMHLFGLKLKKQDVDDIKWLAQAGYSGEDLLRLWTIDFPLERKKEVMAYLNWFGLSRQEITALLQDSDRDVLIRVDDIAKRLIDRGSDWSLLLGALQHNKLALLERALDSGELAKDFSADFHAAQRRFGAGFTNEEQKAFADAIRYARAPHSAQEFRSKLEALTRGGKNMFAKQPVDILMSKQNPAELLYWIYLFSQGKREDGALALTNGKLGKGVINQGASRLGAVLKEFMFEAWEDSVAYNEIQRLMQVERDGMRILTDKQTERLRQKQDAPERFKAARELAQVRISDGKYLFSLQDTYLYLLVFECAREKVSSLVSDVKDFLETATPSEQTPLMLRRFFGSAVDSNENMVFLTWLQEQGFAPGYDCGLVLANGMLIKEKKKLIRDLLAGSFLEHRHVAKMVYHARPETAKKIVAFVRRQQKKNMPPSRVLQQILNDNTDNAATGGVDLSALSLDRADAPVAQSTKLAEAGSRSMSGLAGLMLKDVRIMSGTVQAQEFLGNFPQMPPQ